LADLPPGQSGEIAFVPDEDPALLRYLAEVGLVPGAVVTVLDREPFDGPLYLKVGSLLDRRPVSLTVCHQVVVVPSQAQESTP
jgi:Fe2+ transport system protein FeoA